MTKTRTALKVVDPDLAAQEAEFTEAAKQSAPIVQRLATHRDRIGLAVKELESERFELVSRLDVLRAQFLAVEAGIVMHIEDVDATLALYEGGLNRQPGTGSGA